MKALLEVTAVENCSDCKVCVYPRKGAGSSYCYCAVLDKVTPREGKLIDCPAIEADKYQVSKPCDDKDVLYVSIEEVKSD